MALGDARDQYLYGGKERDHCSFTSTHESAMSAKFQKAAHVLPRPHEEVLDYPRRRGTWLYLMGPRGTVLNQCCMFFKTADRQTCWRRRRLALLEKRRLYCTRLPCMSRECARTSPASNRILTTKE